MSQDREKIIRQYLDEGFWTRELTVDFWDRNAELYPDREAIVDSKIRLTWSQAKKEIDRIAMGLLERGYNKGDVMLVQIYNSVDLVLIRLACEKAGIFLAIVASTFRHAELQFVLNKVEARGAFIPYEFKGFNHFEMFNDLRSQVPTLEHIVVVGETIPEGALSLNEMKQHPLEEKYPKDFLNAFKFEPFGFEEIMTTSGTTGIPKCVQWPNCARLSHARVAIERLKLNEEDVFCAFSPSTGAATEFLTYRCPPQIGAKTVMMEKFAPKEACELIQRERITVGGIVPPMITRLVNYPNLQEYDLGSLRLLLSTAALLPYQIAVEAEEKLGCTILSGYGSMDSGGVSLGSLDDPRDARLQTVGKPLTGSEVKLVNNEGKEVPLGEIGLVTVRGPHCTEGYYNDPQATEEAWKTGRFNLGDLGRFDEGGRLQLVGRQKDVIIRGGQNVYPKELEDFLVQHPKILEVAVVKMPDPELGEKACACVVNKLGETLNFEEMVSFLLDKGIAKFKLPERLEVLDALPLAPAGNKVNKRALEEEIVKKLESERAGQ